jgi:hypothetical protein
MFERDGNGLQARSMTHSHVFQDENLKSSTILRGDGIAPKNFAAAGTKTGTATH